MASISDICFASPAVIAAASAQPLPCVFSFGCVGAANSKNSRPSKKTSTI
jgi:hypothetical protein